MVDLERLTELIAESRQSLAAIRHRSESYGSERERRVTEKLDSLHRLDLHHDELLRRTARAEEWAEFLEEVNEDYKYLLGVHQNVIDLQSELLKQQIASFQKLYEIGELQLQVTETGAMCEGMLKGRDAQKIIQAKKGASGKIAKDPKQTDKAFVFDCWQSWQKNPNSYKGKAKFAKDMLNKCEHLESQKVIEDWCREWEKNTGTQPAE